MDLTNPQTWNRYAYVGNNPLSFVDRLGLSCEDPHDGQPCNVDVTAPFPPDVPVFYAPHYHPFKFTVEMFDDTRGDEKGQFTFKVNVKGKLPTTAVGTTTNNNDNSDLKAFHWGIGSLVGPNYCGPGGTGTNPSNGVDGVCMVHDRCYNDAGINWRQASTNLLTQTQRQGMKACDAQLCKALPQVWTGSSKENAEAFVVGGYFFCTP